MLRKVVESEIGGAIPSGLLQPHCAEGHRLHDYHKGQPVERQVYNGCE